MDRLVKALRWLIPLLEARGGRYQISGGFAAHLYGGRRPVNDIDVDVPRDVLDQLVPLVADYTTYGPGPYSDSTWDIPYLVGLKYGDQEIDLTAADGARISNKSTCGWDPLVMRLDAVERVEYGGLTLRVQNREDLIAYKSKIKYGEHNHLADIEDIRRAASGGA